MTILWGGGEDFDEVWHFMEGRSSGDLRFKLQPVYLGKIIINSERWYEIISAVFGFCSGFVGMSFD